MNKQFLAALGLTGLTVKALQRHRDYDYPYNDKTDESELTTLGEKLKDLGVGYTRNFPNIQPANTCCGAGELTSIDGLSKEEIGTAILNATSSELWDERYSGFVYYGVDASVIRKLKSLGFEKQGSFKNRSTGNTISVMFLQMN